MDELNSGPPKTNPSSGREEDLNSGPPDYKSSALPLGHARLPKGRIPPLQKITINYQASISIETVNQEKKQYYIIDALRGL